MPQIVVFSRQILCFNIMKMSKEDKRFVIQKHTRGKDVHWDFMLQLGESLQTYRLDKAPEEVLYQTANAVKIFNHPLKFLGSHFAIRRKMGSPSHIRGR